MADMVLDGVTLVVGLGKSGLSALRALARRGAELRVTDSRDAPPGLAALQRDYPHVPRWLGGFDAAAFADVARIVISPGVSLQTGPIAAAAARGVPVWGDVELFARLNDKPVAAITGSNGKSTVTALLGLMAKTAGLRAAVGANLGTPVLDLLHEDAELFVLELSSFQLESTYSLRPKVATVLNLSPDHMDRYASLDDYAAAKLRIFRNAECCVVNGDDPRVAAPALSGRSVRFTLREPQEAEFGLRQGWLSYGREPWLGSERLKLLGAHNLANALAALAMGHALGLARAPMLAALQAFQGLPHRSQLVAEHGGVRWFDDSKGTNVGATVAAVTGLPGGLVLIAGGEGKNQDFGPLREALPNKVHDVVVIGRDGPKIAATVADLLPVHRADSMEQAVALAARLAHPGDSVLLSPACASFDMFDNYEARGAAFAAAARRQTQSC